MTNTGLIVDCLRCGASRAFPFKSDTISVEDIPECCGAREFKAYASCESSGICLAEMVGGRIC